MTNVEMTLRTRLALIINGLGYEFVGSEWYREGGQSSLRLYIDKVGGVTLTDCTSVSRQVGAVLDVEALVPGHYCLEVSSPGLNRPLFNVEQYQQFIGRQISVRLREPHEGRRQLKGVLRWVNDPEFCVEIEEGERVLPFAKVARAHLVAEVFPKKQSSRGGPTGSRKKKRGEGHE